MTRESVQEFSRVSSAARNDVYGIPAIWNSQAITLACHLLSDLELQEGGWERRGMIRALFAGINGPREHDEVFISDPRYSNVAKKWVVRTITVSEPHNSTSYMLEPV